MINYIEKDVNAGAFADDTGFGLVARQLRELEASASRLLINIRKYCHLNKLKLNIGKTKCMLFNKSANINLDLELKINHEDIELVNSYKYLGFHIDSKLTMENVCNNLVNKLEICASILCKCRYFLTNAQLHLLFNSLGIAYINYFSVCILNMNRHKINRIKQAYNHCGSVLNNCYKNALHQYKWTDLDSLIKFIVLKMLFKIVNCRFCPPIRELLFRPQLDNICYSLRHNNHNMQVKRFKSSYGQRSIEHWGPKLWNMLPNNLKDNMSLRKFELEVKELYSPNQ